MHKTHSGEGSTNGGIDTKPDTHGLETSTGHRNTNKGGSAYRRQAIYQNIAKRKERIHRDWVDGAGRSWRDILRQRRRYSRFIDPSKTHKTTDPPIYSKGRHMPTPVNKQIHAGWPRGHAKEETLCKKCVCVPNHRHIAVHAMFGSRSARYAPPCWVRCLVQINNLVNYL